MTSPESSQPIDAATASSQRAAPRPPLGAERRKNPRLRELIDEMLVSVRVAVNRDLWTPDERVRAEQELNAIMRRVREHAIASPH